MAIFGALFAAIGRVFGRVANMALGWASVLLFGRIPQDRQLLLTFITLGSIAWVAAVVGVLLPSVGTILLAAVPRPGFVPELWIRIAMLVIAIVLPLAIGAGTILLLDPGRRPSGRGLILQVLRGYPYAAVLAVILVFLAIVGLVRKARSLARRWEDAHVPVIVKPGAYERVTHALERALDAAGLDTTRERAPRPLEVPARLLAAVGGPGVKGLVPDHLVELKSAGLEVLVYPSDIAILGRKQEVARARAALTTRLTHTDAYLTTSREAQQVEDRLMAIAAQPSVTADDFVPIDETLGSLTIPADEWQTLYRERLQVENERRLPAVSRPGLPSTGDASARASAADGGTYEPDPLGWAAALASLALLAADVVLGLREALRREPVRREPRRSGR
jgi:hypothetical protein